MQKVQAPKTPARGIRVNSNSATVHIAAGEKRTLPDHLARAAGAAGCFVLPDSDEDEGEAEGEGEDPAASEGESNGGGGGESRYDSIVAAVRRVVDRGNSADFTKGDNARPRKGPVKAEAGFDVELTEIEVAFDEVMDDNRA